MRFDIVTLFPQMVEGPLSHSLMGRARESGSLDVHVHDLRAWATGKHRNADDLPYGGGAGMVLKIEPMVASLRAIKAESPTSRVVLMGPGGRPFSQKDAHRLAKEDGVIFLCGHYEGVDDRIRGHVDEEISIGDYVLTGGELPALVILDSVGRLCPGVVGNQDSLDEESFETGVLDHPHFTRPRVFEDDAVPDVLLSGNHANIRRWRREEALRRTLRTRPDLLGLKPKVEGGEQSETPRVTVEDRKFLATLGAQLPRRKNR